MGLAVVYANDAPPMIYVLRIVVGCGWQKRQSSISINAELSSQQRHIGCADAGGASLAIDLAHPMDLDNGEYCTLPQIQECARDIIILMHPHKTGKISIQL
jgi:hypothetical protein